MGKVKDILRAETTATEYQFPMGKVKGQRNQRTCVHGYVSIPYGKGKEQHLVLCFYYNT